MIGINWSEKNIYDAIGRPDLKPLTKEEMETKVALSVAIEITTTVILVATNVNSTMKILSQ